MLFVDETMFSSQYSLVTDHLAIYARVVIWALYAVLLADISTFMLKPHCLDYCCFRICFEIRKCEVSNFVLLFKILLTIQGPCYSV